MLTARSAQPVPLLIIGAGPIGLATAAKCAMHGVDFRLIEAGAKAGRSVVAWSHVRLFSPWRECIDEDSSALLQKAGWVPPPPDEYPTGRQLLRSYLRPLSDVPAIADRSFHNCRVTQVRRAGVGRIGFIATTERGQKFLGRAVIDASGTWGRPRMLPRTGLRRSHRVHYRVPDVGRPRARLKLEGKRVAIIGAGHSGMTLLLTLVDLIGRGELLWVRRGPVIHTGAPIEPGSARLKLEERADRAAADANVRTLDGATIYALHESNSAVILQGRTGSGAEFTFRADHVFAALGFDPDHEIASGLNLAIDERLGAPAKLAGLIDPAKHSCNTVPPHGWEELAHPETGYFILGSKSYGRAPNFALTTGYRQIDSVLAHLYPAQFAAMAAGGTCSPCVARCA